jgi:hypothetical protein
MIAIHTTKKLYAKLPTVASMKQCEIEESEANTLDSADPASRLGNDNPLSGWHANLLILQRRNCILLVHDATRFPLFMKGLVKADFAHFDRLFADGYRCCVTRPMSLRFRLQPFGARYYESNGGRFRTYVVD